jgi:tetratricopeptide (TPR) repeat protein
MIARFNKLLLAFLLVGTALYIVLLNTEQGTFNLTRNWSVSAASGVLYLALFGAGIFCSACVGLVVGFKSYLRERKLKSKLAQSDSFYKGLLQARALTASGEWQRSLTAWEQIKKKDPTDAIARIEMSRALEAGGDPEEALRVLEENRALDPSNIELLFRTADLQRTLGNKTAALDNITLILAQGPNRRALLLARDLAENLGRIKDALTFNRQLEELLGANEDLDAVRTRLEFRSIIADHSGNPAVLRDELRSFSKKHPNFIPGLQHLAQLEIESANFDEAAQQLIRAAKASRSTSFWNEVSRLWIQQKQPEKALAAARSATKETSGEARIVAELDLIRIQLELHLLDEARRSFEGFDTLVHSAGITLPTELRQQYLILRGYFLALTSQHGVALEVWKDLAQQGADAPRSLFSPTLATRSTAPAPQLSTP